MQRAHGDSLPVRQAGVLLLVVCLALTPVAVIPTGTAQGQSSQTVQFSPAGDGTELLPGGSYVIAIHASGRFMQPDASVSIVSEGPAVIESIDGKGYEGSAGGRTAEATADELRPRGTSVFVSVRIPEDAEIDSVTLSTTIEGTEGHRVEGQQTYTIVGSERRSSAEALAQQARARAQVASAYAEMYNQLTVNADEFNLELRDALVEGITTVAIEATKGYIIGKSKALTQADQARQLAGVAKDGDLPSGLIGEVAPIFDTMIIDYAEEMSADATVRQGDVGTSFEQLAQLYEAEAEAWEQRDRQRARQIIRDEQRVLCNGPAGNRDYLMTLGEPAHKLCGDNMVPPKALEAGSTEHAYYGMVRDYQINQPEYISGYLSNYAAPPAPAVQTERSKADLQQRLRDLEVGESMTVTITAKNGQNGGFVERGYLSLSHSNTLRVTPNGIAEVDRTDSDDPLETAVSRPGDPVSGPGVDTADYPLIDLYEAYRPGESNTYEIEITRTEPGAAWIKYRAAFLPLIHGENFADEFVRAPSDGPTDQQGFSVIAIEASAQQPSKPTTSGARTEAAPTPTDERGEREQSQSDEKTDAETPPPEPSPTPVTPADEETEATSNDGEATTPASTATGQYLENPAFVTDLDGWKTTYTDPPNQARGSATWTDEHGGAAELSVSGAPSNIVIYQAVDQRIPAGTDLTVTVETSGDLSCCGGVTLRVAGESAAHIRHPADGSHTLTYTTDRAYDPGTRVGIRTAIWPGSGQAHVSAVSIDAPAQAQSQAQSPSATSVAESRETSDAGAGQADPTPTGQPQAPGSATTADEQPDATPDTDRPAPATTADGQPPEPTGTATQESGEDLVEAFADFLRDIADALATITVRPPSGGVA